MKNNHKGLGILAAILSPTQSDSLGFKVSSALLRVLNQT